MEKQKEGVVPAVGRPHQPRAGPAGAGARRGGVTRRHHHCLPAAHWRIITPSPRLLIQLLLPRLALQLRLLQWLEQIMFDDDFEVRGECEGGASAGWVGDRGSHSPGAPPPESWSRRDG
jgi:hypothetical protein